MLNSLVTLVLINSTEIYRNSLKFNEKNLKNKLLKLCKIELIGF